MKHHFPTVALSVILSGCVGNHAWRIKYDAKGVPAIDKPLFETQPTNDCGNNPQGPKHTYRLAFVEFDDRGELFEREQLRNALHEIARVKSMARPGNPAAVVLFVHGWKNNAAPDNGNVQGFKKMLACLGPQFNGNDDVADPAKTRVLGIYIGWRGAVLSPPVLKEFTFWDRRDKSQNLPNAHLIETLLDILKTAKGKNYSEETFSVLIGHSFGGGLLESALTQTMTNIVLDTPAGEAIRWPADLVVLVNEASQATQSYQLIESMQRNVRPRAGCGMGLPARTASEFYVPAIISMTSTGDWGTSAVFPIGQAVSRPFNSLRTYPRANSLGLKRQTPMYLNTTAHLKEFFTHVLDEDSASAIAAARAAGCQVALQSDVDIGRRRLKFQVVERPGAKNLTPYWVMQMPPSLVPDHSTIFNLAFRDLLVDLVVSRTMLPFRPYIRVEPN